MNPNQILLNRDPKTLQRLLPLLLHLLGLLQLHLPSLLHTSHQLLTRLKLILQLRFRNGLELARGGLVLDHLLRGGNGRGEG
jgi:energy-converting hydrogenase Eha subunit F